MASKNNKKMTDPEKVEKEHRSKFPYNFQFTLESLARRIQLLNDTEPSFI